jgi:outer membrane protein OmpA-like peptidoglycan-associated protein
MYITRNNIEGTKIHRSSDKTVLLKIFKSTSSGGTWGKPESFQFNSDNYSCAHPALSSDGTKLYFASNMPGGKGGMDIYVCNKSGNGWGKPENLGDTINTKGNEVFPVIMEDGTLYFSSDGHPGIGGLDIYYTRDIGGKYVLPVNVGYPLNTSEDDFEMVYDVKNKIGYLSSNRANRGFDDDVYSFRRKSIRIKGIVINKETGSPVPNAKVELTLENNTLNFTTQENGRFDFPADFDKNYTLKGSAKDLGDTTITMSTVGVSVADPYVRIELGRPAPFSMIINVVDADTKQPLPGATIRDDNTQHDLGSTDATGNFTQPIVPKKDEQLVISIPGYRPKVIMLKGQEGELPKDITYTVEMTAASDVHPWESWYKIVYYDLNKYNMREDAAKTMDEVAAFLIAHPEVRISINSHTDSRASKEYNEKLSENRSKSCKQYLMSKGVSAKQIEKLLWSGESVLINNCGDSAPCTEEMHQLNRRTELTVTSVKK